MLTALFASVSPWAITRFLSPPVVAGLAVLGFYEGVPVIKEIPGIRHVPLVGPSVDRIVTGRVSIVAREAAEAAVKIERQAWQDRVAALEKQAAADKAAKTEEINKITREFLLSGAHNAVAAGALEEVIHDIEQSNPQPRKACDGSDVPAVSKRLSKSLGAIR